MRAFINKPSLSMICLILLSLYFALPVSLTAIEKPDTISFIHITDIHICNLTPYHPVIAQRRQHFGQGVEPFTNFLKSAPGRLNADYVVITGDLIDFYEAETASGDMLDTEIEQFVRHTGVSNVPVYLTLGNHDVASYRVNSETSYYSEQYNAGKARAAWIRNAPCFRNGTYYSRTFMVDTTTYRLIFLDNAYYSPQRTPESTAFTLDPYQLYWLDNELKQSDTDVEIIFMHMPLFNLAAEDLAPGRNKYHMNPADTVALHHKLNIPDTDSLSLYNVLKQNSSVRFMLTGHQHSGVIHEVQISDDYSLIHMMTGAFGYHPNNWRLIRLTRESIIICHPGDSRTQYTISLEGK